jgi:glycolate oxidase FAD binding subunit
MTDVTIKTLPRAETEATVFVRGLDHANAVAAMIKAMGTPCDVSGAAHLPAMVAKDISVGAIAGAGAAVTLLRLEGVAPSVTHRTQILQRLVKPFGELGVLADVVSRQLWRAIRDVAPFAASRQRTGRPVWRVSTPPDRGARVGKVAEQRGGEVMYDWAGGLVWIAPASDDADAGAGWLRRALAQTGGHATLVRAPAAVRAAVDVFEPQDSALAALTKRVKESFDPHGVLNRGRMYAGV